MNDNENGFLNITGGSSWTDGQTVYAAILYLHNDAEDYENPDFYMANLASGMATEIGGTVNNLGNTFPQPASNKKEPPRSEEECGGTFLQKSG